MEKRTVELRLQKVLSQGGITSRRKAESMIREGRVTVNGFTVRELGFKVKPEDTICVDGKTIHWPKRYRYLMVYKPRGYVTTMSDPQGRPTVADLVKNIPERLYPVGRLDYDSEGLLFMTNDGDFAFRVQHPRFQVPKVYRVKVKGHFSPSEEKDLWNGIRLKDGLFKPEEIKIEKILPRNTWLLISVKEGRNRVIRRALESLGFQVIRLIRIRIGTIELGALKPGRYRNLEEREISELLS